MANAEVIAKQKLENKENREAPTMSATSEKTRKAPVNSGASGSGLSSTPSTAKAKACSQNTPPTAEAVNREMISIMQSMNSNLNKQTEKLEQLAQQYDNMYYYGQEDEQYDDYELYDHDEQVSHSQEENQDNVNVLEASDEPVAKKPRSEKFKNLSDRYEVSEKTDNEVDDGLASFVNKSFRNGVSDDRTNEMIKDIYRPSNCSALTKTRVNGGIWRLLKPQTQTDDSKMQVIQNLMIKASTNVVKLLDKEELDSQSVEWGTGALALLGQANKLLNNKRKESHKPDLDPRYHPLCSPSLPFTDNLYGDDADINKNVKDIHDLSKLGRGRGAASYRGYGRRRGGRRGSDRPGRGRPFYRGSYSGYGYPGSGASQSKNQKAGHKK